MLVAGFSCFVERRCRHRQGTRRAWIFEFARGDLWYGVSPFPMNQCLHLVNVDGRADRITLCMSTLFCEFLLYAFPA
jgi:hypothetical protein